MMKKENNNQHLHIVFNFIYYIESPNKMSNNISDQKVDMYVLNDCVNGTEDIKDKELNVTIELSR